jgi:antitoxin component YwqK of YwqJK toxin-antitoxin module
VKIYDGLDDEIRVKNESITKSENEIVRRNAIIERKQGIIDQFNKKFEQLMTSAGVSSSAYDPRSDNSAGWREVFYKNTKLHFQISHFYSI